MNADILNIDKFVEVEQLKEITTSNMFTKSSSEPDPEGLVSYEIFGDPSSSKRKTTFAYIDLGGTFINPLAYEVLVYLKRTMIQDVVDGNGEFFIRNGEIVKVTQKDLPDPKDDVGAGTVWLKNHFNEIIFKNKSGSEIVADRINFIKTCTLDEIFITKWLVLPAFYRDVDVYSSKKNDINIMYQFIISQASMLKSSKGMFNDDYIVTDAHKNIQTKINEMYRYFVTFIAGTKAFMQSYVLGKGTDYSARMVISTPKINTESPDDMEVDFGHSATPLPMMLDCFAPFIHYGFKEFVTGKINGSKFLYTRNNKGEIERVELADNWEDCLLKDNIQKLIELYVDSKEHRLDYFTLETKDGRRLPLSYISTSGNSTDPLVELKNIEARPLTLCEMFYMICYNTCKDKYVEITRYPVEDRNNIFPTKARIIPFYKTEKRTIDGVEYPMFPVITKKDIEDIDDVGRKFQDTLRMFPTFLKALEADFDGDQTSVDGIFTENSGCEEYVYSKANWINIGGGTMRSTGDIVAHTLYALTKEKDE